MLIDYTYFFGEILVAQRSQESVLENLNFFIKKYESRLLDMVLGLELNTKFQEGLVEVPIDTKWTNLKDGVIYANGTKKWMGFVNDGKESIIANYVYYWYTRDQISQTVGMGEVATKGENAVKFTSAYKQARAWNEMVDWIESLHEYLIYHISDYPDYQFHHRHHHRRCRCHRCNSHEFVKINSRNF